MKKPPRKLVLRRQTLRLLANTDLAGAVGGFDSSDVRRPAVADSGDFACPTTGTGVAAAASR
jgi:hypothetical protein